MWVIQRSDGSFVAKPGNRSSYTKFLQMARTYATKEAAEKDRCPGNECVVHIEDCFCN